MTFYKPKNPLILTPPFLDILDSLLKTYAHYIKPEPITFSIRVIRESAEDAYLEYENNFSLVQDMYIQNSFDDITRAMLNHPEAVALATDKPELPVPMIDSPVALRVAPMFSVVNDVKKYIVFADSYL
jgi:hypothetical protein